MQDKRLTTTALLSATAIVLSVAENAIFGGALFGIPGAKLGLANIAVLLALVLYDGKTALLIGIIKALANFFVSGAITALWYALAGTLLSVFGMWLLLRFTRCFSLAGISAFGGFLANLAQLCVMMLLTQTAEFLCYLPLLTVFGTLSGAINGCLAERIRRAIRAS